MNQSMTKLFTKSKTEEKNTVKGYLSPVFNCACPVLEIYTSLSHVKSNVVFSSDELDHLLEDRSDKMKPSSSHLHRRQAYPPLRRQAYDTVSPPAPTRPREHSPHSHRQPLYSYSLPTASQGPPYLTHNPIAFSFQCPVTQQPGTILPSNTGALESPLPAQTPPSYRAALQATGGDSRSMQELLLEGDLSTDIDALNPSLTDLQLHGIHRHAHRAFC